MNPSSIIHPLSFGIRVLSFGLVLCQPLVWQFWMTARSRQSTFFDLRVQPDFPESPAGRGILRTFRRRLWIASAIMATMYAVVSSRQPLELSTLWLSAAMLATMPCRWIALSSARRATLARAPIMPEPSIRTAALFDENDRAAPWLPMLEWTGILLPLAVPLATAVYIALNHGPRRSLIQLVFLVASDCSPPRASSRCGLALAAAIGRRTRIRAGNTELCSASCRPPCSATSSFRAAFCR
jgi:hypothetical protein